MTDLQTIRDLLPAYAIGAVNEEERASIEVALTQHPDLQDELSSYDAIFEGLALTVPQVDPPDDLGARLFERARKIRSVSFPIRNWRWYVFPAAAVLMVLFGVLIWQVATSPSTSRIDEILNESESRTFMIAGAEDFENVVGRFVLADNRQQAVLELNNLPHMEEKSFQLWLTEGGVDKVSAALIEANRDKTLLLVNIPVKWESIEAIGMTVEPKGGSPAPSGARVFGFDPQGSK